MTSFMSPNLTKDVGRTVGVQGKAHLSRPSPYRNLRPTFQVKCWSLGKITFLMSPLISIRQQHLRRNFGLWENNQRPTRQPKCWSLGPTSSFMSPYRNLRPTSQPKCWSLRKISSFMSPNLNSQTKRWSLGKTSSFMSHNRNLLPPSQAELLVFMKNHIFHVP